MLEVLHLPSLRLGNVTLGTTATLSLTVPRGSTFYADIYCTNTTAASVTKDILVAYGTYDASTGVFTIYWGYVAEDATIPVGTEQLIGSMECTAEQVGTWDVLAAIGSYDPETGSFTVEHAIVKEDELIVTGVAVTDVVLHT